MAKPKLTAYRVRMMFGKWYCQFFVGDQLQDEAIECDNIAAAQAAGVASGLPDYERQAKGDRP